jgi:hypothetical protein
VRKGRRWGRRQERGGGAWGWHRGRRCSGDNTDSGGRGGGVGEPREVRRWHRIWTTCVGGRWGTDGGRDDAKGKGRETVVGEERRRREKRDVRG